MLQKYLKLFQDATDKLTSLGGGNNTWGDYFQTVGAEILVLLLGIAYIAAIVLIIAVPTVGLIKTKRLIKIKDAFCQAGTKIKDLSDFHNYIDDFVNLVNKRCIWKIDYDKLYKDSTKAQNETTAVDCDWNNKELRAAFHKILRMMQKYNIDTTKIAKDVSANTFSFNQNANSFSLNQNEIDFSWIAIKDKLLELYPNYDSIITSAYRYLMDEKEKMPGMEKDMLNIFEDFDWTNYGDFATLHEFVKTGFGKFKLKYRFKTIGSCIGILVVYAIFVVPLILMLFR